MKKCVMNNYSSSLLGGLLMSFLGIVGIQEANAQIISTPTNTAPKSSFPSWYYSNSIIDATDNNPGHTLQAPAGNGLNCYILNPPSLGNTNTPGLISPAIQYTGSPAGTSPLINIAFKVNTSGQAVGGRIWWCISATPLTQSSIVWGSPATPYTTTSVNYNLNSGGTGTTWTSLPVQSYNIGSSTPNASTSNPYYIYIMVTGDFTNGRSFYIDDISFAISNTNPLPIHYLKDPTITQKGSGLMLDWVTGTEINNKGFMVQRSSGNNNWSDISFVPSSAEGGNSSSAINYSYTDPSPLPGLNCYRLIQTDIDGTIAISKVVSFDFRGDKANVVIAPNPVSTTLTLNLKGDVPANAIYRIVNGAGQTVKTIAGIDNNNNSINVAGLDRGVYFLQIIAENNQIQTLRFIKE